jgi:hypothetical protein
LHVFGGTGTSPVHFHNKFDVFHGFPLARDNKWEARFTASHFSCSGFAA